MTQVRTGQEVIDQVAYGLSTLACFTSAQAQAEWLNEALSSVISAAVQMKDAPLLGEVLNKAQDQKEWLSKDLSQVLFQVAKAAVQLQDTALLGEYRTSTTIAGRIASNKKDTIINSRFLHQYYHNEVFVTIWLTVDVVIDFLLIINA